ncbi:MAG: long-chain-fatty-acid--CoA ligase [Pseudolabrys sp.]|nr:long-chain-fatty-acid--CoA ligase [Pseudolabrys sp.]MBV9954751.1 long-chain-fatty-acid--CoA ligase [Pseudolabrys sp.]
MDRIWLRNYPPGVPHEIDLSLYSSLVALLEESFAKYGSRDAFVFMGKRLTFAELDEKSRALGAWLQSRGLQRGARVALMMPNVLQYPIAIAAVLRAGYVVVNVNPLYTPRELEFQLKDSGAEAIIVLENFASVLQKALPATKVKHVVIASMGDMLGLVKGAIVNLVVRRVKKLVPDYALPEATHFNDALNAGATLPLNKPVLGQEDTAFLQYTGGTTGVSKGAVLVHRNLLANVLQVEAWHGVAMKDAHGAGQAVIVTALPLYHIFALTACFLYGLRSGALCLLIPNPRDLPALIKELSHYKITSFPAVNTLFNGLLNHPDFKTLDWSNLKLTIGGGMSVQRSVADAWYKATGNPVVEGYGLSETSPVLTANRPDITEWTGTIGLPMPSTDISIRDDAGNELPLGERGEICARGPQVMAGYWQRPDETAKVMTKDGFFRTGDIGVMDEQGRITIVDRKKDMISVSGFKVFPNEVEDVAMTQGGLLECACVGVPDSQTGEAVKLYAVKKSPELSERDLQTFLRGKLTNYKVPKHIEFRQELPKTNVGKILRRALRDEAVAKANAA